MEKIDQILESLYDRVIEPLEAKEQLLLLFAVSNRREQLIAFAQWLAHEEEYGRDGSVGTVDAYLESN